MRKSRLTTHIVAFGVAPDTLFTPLYMAAVIHLLGLEAGAASILAILLYLVRIAVYASAVTYFVGPGERLLQQATEGRTIAAERLQRADFKIQSTPFQLGVLFAIMWGLQVPLLMLSYHRWVGLPGLISYEPLVVALLAVAGAGGAFAVMNPVLTWALTDTAGHLHQIAQGSAIDLERQPRSVAMRLTMLGVFLSSVPVLLIMAALVVVQNQGLVDAAQLEARATLEAIATADGARLPTSGPLDERHGAAKRITMFTLGADGTLVTAGAPAPMWATPELLRAIATGQRPAPDPTVSVKTRTLEGHRIVGALAKIDSLQSGFIVLALTLLVVLGMWGPLCAWLMSRSVSLPLELAADAARRAVEKGDLSKMPELRVAGNDEVGQVTANLNALLNNMRNLAAASSEVGAGNLNVKIEGNGELVDAFRQMLLNLRKMVTEMRQTAAELATAATEIFAAAQEQEAASVTHAAGMTEITQTMDSLSDAAAHVALAVQGVLGNAERTLSNTDQMVARINELTGRANRIADILDVIREIADRTDLLALNGSLEATRAGEAGLGFSLVASEMRRLAERVTASVGDIKSLIGDIRESGASTVVATEESRKLAESTTEAARGITLVTQQQQTSTEQVTENVRGVAHVTGQAASATTQTRTAAEQLKENAERLARTVASFKLDR